MNEWAGTTREAVAKVPRYPEHDPSLANLEHLSLHRKNEHWTDFGDRIGEDMWRVFARHEPRNFPRHAENSG